MHVVRASQDSAPRQVGALVLATSGYVAASRSRRAAGVLLAARKGGIRGDDVKDAWMDKSESRRCQRRSRKQPFVALSAGEASTARSSLRRGLLLDCVALLRTGNARHLTVSCRQAWAAIRRK
jgi:hypothetical protein